MDPLRIEEMKAGDVAEVAELAAQLGYPESATALGERFAEIRTLPTHAVFVARSADGGVIGWVQINRDAASLIGGARAIIAGLVVDAQHRGRGIGAALLHRAEDWARSKGLPVIRVGSRVTRTDAHRFYERDGYRIEKSWHLFTKQLL